MRALALDLGRARDCDRPIGLLYAPIKDRRPKRALTFAESGFSFIPLRQAHLDFMATVYGRCVPIFEECEGRSLVDERYLPLGVLLVHFEPGGRNVLHAHFGKWLRQFPVACLRAIKEVTDALRARGIFILHCSADATVAGSTKLIAWLKGEPTGERDDHGAIFRIDLRRTPI
jgi:hypothetical protein